jgi:hypothetical protein
VNRLGDLLETLALVRARIADAQQQIKTMTGPESEMVAFYAGNAANRALVRADQEIIRAEGFYRDLATQPGRKEAVPS